MIPQIFIPTVEPTIPTESSTNEINAETETQPFTAEIKKKTMFEVNESPAYVFMLFSH